MRVPYRSRRGLALVVVVGATLAADAAWPWKGRYGNGAVEMLIIGDVQVHSRRSDPTTAFHRMRDTLTRADLVYANLEGLLVTSVGTRIVRTSFVPVTRDDANDVSMLDPGAGEGAALVQAVRDRSVDPPPLRLDGREVVLDTFAAPSDRR
jgi:hypothetical protein